MKYTAEELDKAKTMYRANYSIADIAVVVGKSMKSVIAKLAAEGVYVKNQRASKLTGEKPRTKKEFVSDICEILELNDLMGLEQASKGSLIKLKEELEKWLVV